MGDHPAETIREEDVLQVRHEGHIPSVVNHIFFEQFVHHGDVGGIFKKTTAVQRKQGEKSNNNKKKKEKALKLPRAFDKEIAIDSIQFAYPIGDKIVFVAKQGNSVSVVGLRECQDVGDENVSTRLMNFLKSADSVVGSRMYNSYYNCKEGGRVNKGRVSIGGPEPFKEMVGKKDRSTSASTKVDLLLPKSAMDVFEDNMEVGMGGGIVFGDETNLQFDTVLNGATGPEGALNCKLNEVVFTDKLKRKGVPKGLVYCPSIPEESLQELNGNDMKSKLLFLNVGMKVRVHVFLVSCQQQILTLPATGCKTE